jgi:hypothetical protein
MLDAVSYLHFVLPDKWPKLTDVQKMASNSFALFVQQISHADDELQVKVVQIVYDLLMVHDIETLVAGVMPVRLLSLCSSDL